MASIYLRGNVYYSRIRINGKEIRKPLGTDKDQAIRRLGDLIKARESDKMGEAVSNISLEAFLERYLVFSKSTKNRNTHNTDKRAFQILSKEFPILQLSQITPGLLDRLVARLKDQGKGPSIINRTISALKAAMRKAEDWELRPEAHWENAIRLKEADCKLIWYSIEQLQDLLKFCHGQWGTIALLAARAGLRRAEIYWLSWDDIDFIRNRLHVVKKDGWIPKDYEQRWVPLSSDLRKHLQALPKIGKWVLGDNRASLAVMSTYFKRLSRKAKLDGGIHTLRHTFASQLVAAGVPLFTVMKLLGHSTMKTTQKYAHLAPETVQKDIDKLPALASIPSIVYDAVTI